MRFYFMKVMKKIIFITLLSIIFTVSCTSFSITTSNDRKSYDKIEKTIDKAERKTERNIEKAERKNEKESEKAERKIQRELEKANRK